MRVYNELGQNETTSFVLNDLSLNKLYTLASAPDEFKDIGTTSSVLNTLSLNKLYTLASAPDEELRNGVSRILDYSTKSNFALIKIHDILCVYD